MAELQNFRSALNGFNRQDVVHYIEYMNNRHKTEIDQLNAQLQSAQEDLAKATAPVETDPELLRQLEEAQARCAQLEQEVEALREAHAQPTVSVSDPTAEELEAYRRAERAERQAQERAQQIYAQASAVLADATVQIDEATSQISAVTDQVAEQLVQYQKAIMSAKSAFREASATMYTIRPEND